MSARILVVDDDPMIVRLLAITLEIEGYEVVSAANGKQGLEAIAGESPDLVISDVMMPVMDGRQMVQQIRKDPKSAAMPIVMLSAKAQAGDVAHGMEAGADEYVTKPFDPQELLGVITKLLASKKAPNKSKK